MHISRLPARLDALDLATDHVRWFKQDFIKWVNSPPCSACTSPTRLVGMVPPSQQNRTHGASRVELYKCSAGECGAYERFPRYNDVCAILRSRRGRCGEFANCFGAMCRALGGRVRWVWNAEDHVFTEIWSESQNRWVHVDACEGAWDNPRLYTQGKVSSPTRLPYGTDSVHYLGWGKKMSYCLAFSVDGAADVTNRYVRNPAQQGIKRNRVTEEVLVHILNEIKRIRRRPLSEKQRQHLAEEDEQEANELCCYVQGNRPPQIGNANPPPSLGRNTTSADAQTLPSRLTGTPAWRQSRGENGSSVAP